MIHIPSLCCAAAMLSAAGVSQAVIVANYSFEADPDGSGLAPTGWTWNGLGGGGIYAGGGTEGAGLNLVNLGSGAAVSQTLGVAFANVGDEYVATADARSSWQSVLTITLYSDDGLGSLVDLATTTYDTTPQGNTTVWAPISVSYTSGLSDIGKSIGVRIGSSSGWSEWDNVTVAAIPEPATLSLFGIASVAGLLVRRRQTIQQTS